MSSFVHKHRKGIDDFLYECQGVYRRFFMFAPAKRRKKIVEGAIVILKQQGDI